jgi:hypothetical protein
MGKDEPGDIIWYIVVISGMRKNLENLYFGQKIIRLEVPEQIDQKTMDIMFLWIFVVRKKIEMNVVFIDSSGAGRYFPSHRGNSLDWA